MKNIEIKMQIIANIKKVKGLDKILEIRETLSKKEKAIYDDVLLKISNQFAK